MCIVGRSGDGDGAGAAHVGVAQLVGQLLQLVSFESKETIDHSNNDSALSTAIKHSWWSTAAARQLRI